MKNKLDKETTAAAVAVLGTVVVVIAAGVAMGLLAFKAAAKLWGAL